jgi:threonine/homoserine/homoserine lactone efflux protein
MAGVHDLSLFVVSGLLLAMSPGPDMAYIVGRSSKLGWRGGVMAALGIGTGIWMHIICAAAGVSALLLTSARAFTVLKLAGAAYLLYLGIKMLAGKGQVAPVSSTGGQPATITTVFWQGFLTNILNPKVALFFLAFLPQFIGLGAGSKTISFLFLGLIFDIVGTVWNLLVACVAAQLATRIHRVSSLRLWIDRALGATFIYVGFRLASAQRR